MEPQTIRTKRDDDVRPCIEAAIARRKDEFALKDLVWTADGYGYIVKFRLGLDDVVRTELRCSCSKSPRAWTECSTGFASRSKALASSSDAFVRRLSNSKRD